MNEDKYEKEDPNIVYSDLVPWLDLQIESYKVEFNSFKIPVLLNTPITKMQNYFDDQELFNEFSEWAKKKADSDTHFSRLAFFEIKYANEFIHEKLIEIYKCNKLKGKMSILKTIFSTINSVGFYKKLKELNDGTCKS